MRLIIFIKIQYKIDKLMEIFSVICFQSIIPLLLNNKTCRGLLLKFISYAMSSAVYSKISPIYMAEILSIRRKQSILAFGLFMVFLGILTFFEDFFDS